MYRDDLKNAISNSIERNPTVFEKNLHTQMEVLVSAPLREVAAQTDRPRLRGAIIIDGVDECEAEQFHDVLKADLHPARANEKDQFEILTVLQEASSDPSFPFRILIASRPERVFRDFFDPENTAVPFAHKLDLHEQYNADADITLFLEAQFNRLRRRYKFLPSWPPPGTIPKLVENASGQFIYAATVIRLLETPHRETPKALLASILEEGVTPRRTSSPFGQLDALYARILESSPDARLSIQWIRSIKELNVRTTSSASNVNLLLQTDPESDEAEHLLGNLHSLIQIPPLGDQGTARYGFYHKSLFDFLEDFDRCESGNHEKLYFEQDAIEVFMWDMFIRACMNLPDNFLVFLAAVPRCIDRRVASSSSKVYITPAGAVWWMSLAITHQQGELIWDLFQNIHSSCSRSRRCHRACRTWSSAILRRLGSIKWIAPGLLWPSREGVLAAENKEFNSLLLKAIPDVGKGPVAGDLVEDF
ncbi:hypothetical protein MD484_g3091, partial [Candolleomyces efflorescens]